MKVTAGKVQVEDKQRLEQEQQSEEKRLAIMMMKKREKYLYKKIMFGKKRKIREVQRLGPSPTSRVGLFPNPLAPSMLPVPGEGVEVPPSVPRLPHGGADLPVPPQGRGSCSCSPYLTPDPGAVGSILHVHLELGWDRGVAGPVLL